MTNDKPYMAALDVGASRIGVAIARTDVRLPSPHTTLSNDDQLWQNLTKLIDDEQVGRLVVGLPRGLDGQETAQTEAVRDFVEQLKQHTDLPIFWQDEAATSLLAEAELEQRGKGYNKGQVDALAATIILQDYLSSTEESPA